MSYVFHYFPFVPTFYIPLSLLDSIILGIVQGLTEFIPVSSTAHLTIAGKLLGLVDAQHPEQWTAYIAVIQLGTLIAVVCYFWKRLYDVSISFLKEALIERRKISEYSRTAMTGWHIIIGTIPVVVIGLLIKKLIEGSATKNLWLIATNLFIFAIGIAIAEKFSKRERSSANISWRDTISMGCAQVFALMPGASRSGVTISAGLFSGLTREAAAEYSFFLSIPAVLGSGLFELKSALKEVHIFGKTELIVGTLTAAIVGYASIWFLIRYLKTHTNYLFVWYRIALGIFILGLLFFSYIQP